MSVVRNAKVPALIPAMFVLAQVKIRKQMKIPNQRKENVIDAMGAARQAVRNAKGQGA